jgi:hypothetical protein
MAGGVSDGGCGAADYGASRSSDLHHRPNERSACNAVEHDAAQRRTRLRRRLLCGSSRRHRNYHRGAKKHHDMMQQDG